MSNDLKELLNAKKAWGPMFAPGLMIILVVLLLSAAILFGSGGE